MASNTDVERTADVLFTKNAAPIFSLRITHPSQIRYYKYLVQQSNLVSEVFALLDSEGTEYKSSCKPHSPNKVCKRNGAFVG